MNFAVFLFLTVSFNVVVNADILWQHSHSPLHYGSSKLSSPSYEALRNHIRAKYYAQKAHDLAKIRSSIYGIGHGLYGFRYGSHFPHHISKPFPLLPFVNKYPVFDMGLNHYPFFHMPLHSFSQPHHSFSQPHHSFSQPYFHGISGLLTGFGYPHSYRNSYSHSYSYGKGYEYGNKHSYGFHKPHMYHYSGLKSKWPPSGNYIKKEYPGETLIYESGKDPNSFGYEYSYVKETPGDLKLGLSPVVGSYDSIHGVKYNDFGHDSDHGKFPSHSAAYDSEIPVKSSHHSIIPFSEVELADVEHGGHDFEPLHAHSYEMLSDIDSDDVHSLNIDTGPTYNKFDSSDLIAYGSEKSDSKIKGDN